MTDRPSPEAIRRKAMASALYRLSVATLALHDANAWLNPLDSEVDNDLYRARQALDAANTLLKRAERARAEVTHTED